MVKKIRPVWSITIAQMWKIIAQINNEKKGNCGLIMLIQMHDTNKLNSIDNVGLCLFVNFLLPILRLIETV